ncbi:transposase DNA-binding-containing protein, partial [Ralstonia pseudosolanacearum]
MNAVGLEAPYWTETEFADLDLGDARLNKRA